MKFNRILNILIILLIIALVSIFSMEHLKKREFKKLEDLAEQEAAFNRKPSDENAINLLEATQQTSDGEDVFLSYEDFLEGYKRTSHYVGETSVSYRFSKQIISGGSNIYVLKFKMRAEDEAAKMDVNFGVNHTYYLTTQWRDYYVPCTKGQFDSIKLTITTPFQKIYLSDLEVVTYDTLEVNLRNERNGSYLSDGITVQTFAENSGIGVGKTMDITGDGEYLYSAGEETLKILRITQEGVQPISEVKDIGNIRHVELRNDKHLALASRETGVYVVNIEDKSNPFIESYYDSLEIANDVCFVDNYMIVAGRYFGIEIVDITDISKPEYITRIVNDKECFRCTVNGNYLYVSCWSTGDVEIYDITKINSPELVGSINVTGRCGEVFIENNIAYIVSGYSDFVNAVDIGDAGYGTGNALAIYDISDPKHPLWHSTIKTEGALYGYGYDDWSVNVSCGYAYFTNSFGGMYVYDVSDTKAPVAISNVAVKIPSSSKNFVNYSKNARVMFPYDMNEYIYSPVMGVHADNGAVYFACAYNDVYKFDFENAKYTKKDVLQANVLTDTAKKKESFYDVDYFIEDYDVYTVAKYEHSYVVATGEGLLLLDENMAVVGKTATTNPVKDVRVTNDGYAVTAEKSGVGIYKIEENGFSNTGYLNSKVSNRNVSALGVTGDGNYAVIQSSWTKYELIDIRDKNNPVFLENVVSKNGKVMNVSYLANAGNMYYRNLVIGTPDGAVGIGGGGNMIWFASKDGNLHVKNQYPNRFGSEINGNAVMKNNKDILSIYNNGFVIYNPLDTTEGEMRKLQTCYVIGVRLKGKISIKNDILAICNASGGRIQIVNIKDINMPYLINEIELENSPGIALVEDGFVLVPVRHGGIMKISLE